MQKTLFHLLTVLVLLSVLSACSELPYTNIDNAELAELSAQGVAIVDIRRAEEWQQTGIVKDSETLTAFDRSGRLSANFLPEFTSKYSKDTPVVLICRTGNRTSALANYLATEQGYTNIYNVRDGITSWIRKDQPVVKCNQC